MNNKITNILILLFVLAAVVVGVAAYPYLPERIASHWDANGEVNGYMGKFWGIFLMPVVLSIMFLIYIVIPKIDPLKSNIESFREVYNLFWVAISGFMFYIFALTIAWNFGYRFNFIIFMVPAFAVLWYAIGMLLEKSKRNWFVGIRTPWTLSSDIVWDKTHKLGGKLFKAVAILSLVGLFLRGEDFFLLIILVPAVAVAIITVVYSYVEYRRQGK